MYESFYGLSKSPFSLTPDADCFYMSAQHARALAALRYALLTNAGITVVTGEVGTGKTTLLRKVLERDVSELHVGLINNTHPNMGKLLPWILSAYNIDPSEKGETVLYHTFVRFLETNYETDRRTVLIIDEAQNLTVENLEEVRLLSNLNLDKGSILQVILVGQPELSEKLELDELRQFSQRIAVDASLSEFSLEQTNGYIDYRLGMAGGSPDLFNYEARAIVYYHSLGVPRIINNLCHLCLAFGYADSKPEIGIDIVKQVVESKKIGMSHINRRYRSDDAAKIRTMVLEERGVDIASMERVSTAPLKPGAPVKRDRNGAASRRRRTT
ncbi:MAG: AAA family ATPase [Pseudomonadota bacterium]